MKFVSMESQTEIDVDAWDDPRIPKARSYKPVFKVSGVWYDNGQRFATPAEAIGSARDRFVVWYVPTDCGIAASDDEPNGEWS